MLSPSPISFEGPFAYVPRQETHEGPAKPRLPDVDELLLDADSLHTITVHIESSEHVRLDQLATELARPFHEDAGSVEIVREAASADPSGRVYYQIWQVRAGADTVPTP